MAMYGYVGLCRAMYGYVGLCMAVYGCVGLCRAMLGYVGLCKAIERNVFHILANGEPLYDAYTTYLPKCDKRAPLTKNRLWAPFVVRNYVAVTWCPHL